MNDLGSIPDPADHGPTLRLAADRDGLAQGARLLAAGRLVAFPTETVYGLGADATDPRAVAAIYAAKARPRFNPLIAHVASLEAALREGRFDETALALARAFWPGPLTLVVPATAGATVCDLARAGLASVALRVPGSGIARDLLAAVGRPVAAPSANRSGRVSPTSAADVLADLDGRIAAVIDGGPAAVGVESTVVACLGGPPRLLRPGGVTREDVARVLGLALEGREDDPDAPLSPGLLASHYAPRARVRLDARSLQPGEAVLLFGPNRPAGLSAAVASVNLSPSGDLAEAAAGLFAALRRLDASHAAVIAVAPIPHAGLGEAINDRLARAAAPR
ncbi:translation factor Sua5 [Methylobacterium sp. Leaf399]|uniref:L-threonylcarbamoyladenylate synthase n=1 Tax=unclassified Methylobacterium TaxID=2615210 RepID=UPI0006F4BE5E|nr:MULTISPECIES: L-threonylcarbamoyladenylate synthase [unclassified Methylobacterium]KQT13782.1 translation factor Sua5 [Methylobacterium sp. Leaf399]KQT77759.1 translation factor Sua5 [Methylobacterium sp. Leaf466]